MQKYFVINRLSKKCCIVCGIKNLINYTGLSNGTVYNRIHTTEQNKLLYDRVILTWDEFIDIYNEFSMGLFNDIFEYIPFDKDFYKPSSSVELPNRDIKKCFEEYLGKRFNY